MGHEQPFPYVWGVVRILGSPPTAERLHVLQNGYRFHPFHHTGAVLTVDPMTWDALLNVGSQLTEWPMPDAIASAIADAGSQPAWTMFALSEIDKARTIDPKTYAPLSKIPATSIDAFSRGVSSVGYDTIDVAGLSALSNIGYSPQNVTAIAERGIDLNDYGLFASAQDAREFAEFASLAAREHAPFFPIEVWSNRTSQNGGA